MGKTSTLGLPKATAATKSGAATAAYGRAPRKPQDPVPGATPATVLAVLPAALPGVLPGALPGVLPAEVLAGATAGLPAGLSAGLAAEVPAEAPAETPAEAARRAKAKRLGSLWRRFKKSGDESVRNELVENYLYLVKVISNRIAARLPRSIDIQDLRSAGIFGLMRAVENFDLGRGTPFESYCATRVRGAILDELRSQDWVPRLVRNRASLYNTAVTALRKQLGRDPSAHETAERLALPVAETERLAREANLTAVFTLGPQDERDDDPRVLRRLDVLMDKDSDVPFEKLVAQDLAGSLAKVLGKNECTVVALYYHENLTMREIGSVLGISESRVCQIHTKTLQKLKAHLDSIGVRGVEEMPEPQNPDARF